jgi:16S rRNA (uracil1498-N3)-methyltransferase
MAQMGQVHHRRFYVPPSGFRDGRVEFDALQAHQLVRVLRLGPGDRVRAFDGTGREVLAELEAPSAQRASARVLTEFPIPPGPRLRMTLAQVVPRAPAMDMIVAKATELGVSCIRPLEAAQSVTRASARTSRWLRIAQEAAEQCGRQVLPAIHPICSLRTFLRSLPPGALLLACHPDERARPLSVVCRELSGLATPTLLIGGEGGFRPEEADDVLAHGGRLVLLGTLRLRVETAALAGLTILQACLGDWSRP